MDRLESIVADLREFASEREWGEFHDPKNLAMAVASEAGELLAELRWVANTDSDAFARRNERRSRIAAEVADVGIMLLLLCDRLDLDLVDVMREKLEVNRRNYPADRARGRSERPE